MDSGIEYLMGGWKARAEAAEAENTRLRDVIKRASDAPMLDHSGQQRGVYDILRQALGGEHER